MATEKTSRKKQSTAPEGSTDLAPIKELFVGDRFFAYGSLWTLLASDGHDNLTARRHSADSIKMGLGGRGYRLDTICRFRGNERVVFQAPSQ